MHAKNGEQDCVGLKLEITRSFEALTPVTNDRMPKRVKHKVVEMIMN